MRSRMFERTWNRKLNIISVMDLYFRNKSHAIQTHIQSSREEFDDWFELCTFFVVELLLLLSLFSVAGGVSAFTFDAILYPTKKNNYQVIFNVPFFYTTYVSALQRKHFENLYDVRCKTVCAPASHSKSKKKK